MCEYARSMRRINVPNTRYRFASGFWNSRWYLLLHVEMHRASALFLELFLVNVDVAVIKLDARA